MAEWVSYVARGEYIESAVHILSINSIFGWTTNFTLPLAGAGYCHPANFTCSVLDDIRYTAYPQRVPSRAYHIPAQCSTYSTPTHNAYCHNDNALLL